MIVALKLIKQFHYRCVGAALAANIGSDADTFAAKAAPTNALILSFSQRTLRLCGEKVLFD